MEDIREGNWFPRCTDKDTIGKDLSPLELLILGAFCYLGRGFTFDDLEEATDISKEVHRGTSLLLLQRKTLKGIWISLSLLV